MNDNYQYTPLYYATPCQIRFFNPETLRLDNGIALYNLIISGRDGKIFITDYVVFSAAAYNITPDNAVIELEWLDITKAIAGSFNGRTDGSNPSDEGSNPYPAAN